jgi:hypothetical protein
MAQMIYNTHVGRLLEIPFIQAFMKTHRMHAGLCGNEDMPSLVLYRMPYIIEFYDILVDYDLDILLLEPDANLMIPASRASGLCLEIGIQKAEDVDGLNFKGQPGNSAFQFNGELKMLSLHTDLGAIDKLLPILEEKGGLSSMLDGTFDSRFDLSETVERFPPGLSKDRYTKFMIEN